MRCSTRYLVTPCRDKVLIVYENLFDPRLAHEGKTDRISQAEILIFVLAQIAFDLLSRRALG